MKKNLPLIAIIVVGILITLILTAFTVDQRQAAIKFRLGEVVGIYIQPGLYFKLPLIENVRFYDTRIQTLDTKDAERIQTSEKNNVLVDSFVKCEAIFCFHTWRYCRR
jgi:modulator of FtsH protease HflC